MNAKRANFPALLKHALFIGFCGGICGVLVDFDHIPKYLDLTTAMRPAHLWLGILAGLVACGCLACLGRLFVEFVLKNQGKEAKSDGNRHLSAKSAH